MLSIGQLVLSVLIGQELVWLISPSAKWIELIIKMIVDTVLFFASFRIQNNWVFSGRDEKRTDKE